jgi:MoxR-like ATPase
MRLARAGSEVLSAEPAEAEERHAWRLKLEGIIREIDAGLAPEQMNDELKAVRASIMKVLASGVDGH